MLDRLLPPACAGCGAATEPGTAPVCGPCRARMPAVPSPRCPACGMTRLPGTGGPASCAECEGWPTALRRAESAFLHRPPADSLVRGLKYRGWTALAGWMGGAMAPAADRILGGRGDVVLVPVPLPRARLRERGFNQAERLAAGLAEANGLAVRDCLERGGGGTLQARLDRRARMRNVQGAFRLRMPAGDPRDVPPAALLVDDVLTTGATAAACAEVLEAEGIACLGIVTFARTPPGPE
ncbi:MAG: double zinc ribbon domain-containing protein [Gemmatimonadota bacterium]|nr:double zinc ribbon domain-containing protein [Gemmatimonadota bacterium]